MKVRLSQYQSTEVLVIFDRYDDTSVKAYERIRLAREEAVDYNITTSSQLRYRDAIVKSKANKKAVVRVFSIFNLSNNVTMVRRWGACIAAMKQILSSVIILLLVSLMEAVKNGKKNSVRVISDDTDVFVLLIFWLLSLQVIARM